MLGPNDAVDQRQQPDERRPDVRRLIAQVEGATVGDVERHHDRLGHRGELGREQQVVPADDAGHGHQRGGHDDVQSQAKGEAFGEGQRDDTTNQGSAGRGAGGESAIQMSSVCGVVRPINGSARAGSTAPDTCARPTIRRYLVTRQPTSRTDKVARWQGFRQGSGSTAPLKAGYFGSFLSYPLEVLAACSVQLARSTCQEYERTV